MKTTPVRKIRSSLLEWYEKEKRDLPWRRTADPYGIWLSEVMLQQTTVKVVAERYPAFLGRFPDIASLAGASEEDVLAAWSGLGYYGRARAFHKAARIVAGKWGGRLPEDRNALLSLPGIGPYTAGAVMSIAFGKQSPLVDGNVARVLCRFFAVRGDPASAPLKKRLWSLAAELLPARRPGEFNQALMELGALVCTPRSPSCSACPLEGPCLARSRGIQQELPRKTKPLASQKVALAAALVKHRGRILLKRRSPDEKLLGGIWLFPGGEFRNPATAPKMLSRLVGKILNTPVGVNESSPITVRHSITRYRITLHLFGARPAKKPAPLSRGGAARWIRPARIGTLPVSSLVKKGLKRAGLIPG